MKKDSKKKIEKNMAEEYLDGWKRCKADFENYKKQQQDWTAGFKQSAAREVLEEIIPVIDNFELAVKHIPRVPENWNTLQANKTWLEGIAHIKRQLEEILAGHNVSVIEIQPGDLFDPNIHECVEGPAGEKCETAKSEVPEVAKVIRKGYKMGEKLLRPAQVTLKTTDEK